MDDHLVIYGRGAPEEGLFVNHVPQLASHTRRDRRMVSTRRGLLAAARKLFSEKGLYESRVEEITETADVGKGTLYRYFRNKEALVLAVVEAGFEDLRRGVKERLAEAADLDDAVGAIAESHLRFFAENPDLMRIFHQSRGLLKFNRPEWRPLSASLEGHLEFLAAELRRFDRGQRIGRARLGDLAGFLFGGLSGSVSVLVAVNPDIEIGAKAPLLVAAMKGMVDGGAAAPREDVASRRVRRRGVRPARRGDR